MPRLAFAFLPLLTLLAACATRPVDAATSPPQPEQWSGAHGGSEDASNHIIRDPAEWAVLWQQLGREPPRPLQPARERAVAIFLGERRTGGYRAEVVAVREEDGRTVVEYREHTPDPRRMVTQAITHPWAVAIIPGSDASIAIRKIPEPAVENRDA